MGARPGGRARVSDDAPLRGGWRPRLPIVLRLPLKTPPGLAVAAALLVLAERGVLSSAFGLARPASLALGLTLAAAALWVTEAVPLFVTSLLVLALELAWLGPELTQPGTGLFVNAFFSDVTLLFLGGFVLSAALTRTGLDRRLAQRLLGATRDARGDARPARVLVAVAATTALLSMWMSNTAACALMLGLAQTMLARVPPGDGLRRSLVLTIAFAANLGGLATPIGSPPNAIMLRYLDQLPGGLAPSFSEWMALALPITLGLLVLLVLLLNRRYPSDASSVELPAGEARPFRAPQWLALVTLLVTIAGWLASGDLGLTPGTVALVPVVVFFGTNLLRTEDLRALPWDVLLLIGGGLALGTAIDVSGLAEEASRALPLDGLAPLALIAAAVAAAFGASAAMSNTAAANLLAPLLVGLSTTAQTTGPLFVASAMACSLAMPLPVSTPPNAMAFSVELPPGPTRALDVRDLLTSGTVVGVVGVAVLLALSVSWFPAVLGR